jgi:integrase/recombinase XerD
MFSRHREGPLAEARERFLRHSSDQGLARATLMRIARELLVVAKRLHVGEGKVSVQEIEAAADRWACYQRRRKRARATHWPRQLFIASATSWLLFLDCLRLPKSKISPFTIQVEQFVAFMRNERGLSAATIRNRCWHLGKFLDSLPSRKHPLSRVSMEEVDTYLARKGDQGWSRISVCAAVDALRSFFLYACQFAPQ